MGLFSKKKTAKMTVEPQKPLTQALGYTVSVDTVISRKDCMIVRCIVQFPFTHPASIDVTVKNKSRDVVSTKCVLMGKGEPLQKVGENLVFKELVFSVFVPYPEQDLVFVVTDRKNKQIVHEQSISGEKLKSLRAQQDEILYKFASNDPFYQEWLLNKHRASEYELYLQCQKKLYFMPKFSVVVSLFQSNLSYLTQLLDSIVKQTYSNWEIIFVNASPEIVNLKAGLERLQNEDERIRFVELPQSEGITLNTAHGIEGATGDYVCFVDQHDIIEPNTLFEYAQRINEKPDADVLYCDEDKLFPDGNYGEVFFKPEFSLQYLRTCNYVSHMLCMKTTLLKTLDYKNAIFDGAQDYHLMLQAVEKTKHVERIPRVLYHRRVIDAKSVEGTQVKAYDEDVSMNAAQAHLQRCGVKAKVMQHPKLEYAHRVEYELPAPAPKVSIIIPTNDHVEMLKRCIDSIFEKSTYSSFEVIIVENNSHNKATFEYYDKLSSMPNVKVVEFKGGFNFSKLVNFGRQIASGEYILLLNNDTEVITADWLEKMLALCIQPDVGVVGVKMLFPDETIQHAGVFAGCLPMHYFRNLPNGEISYHDYADTTREISGVAAACLMVSAETYDSVNGFDETLEVCYNDVDFCLRVSRDAGKTTVYEPAVELLHYESVSRSCSAEVETAARLVREKSRMWSDWSYVFTTPDPYATPNDRQGWEGSYFKF